MKVQWRFGIIAAVLLAIFSLYPQFKMFYLRGSEWNGHYAYNDIDEVAYASYVRALMDGRPRKNDPYAGRDDSPDNPQPESLFSIQFAAPYTIALPAKLLGIGAPWAMTISGAVAAFLTALAIFWLIKQITGDHWFAMSGSLVTLAGGAIFAGEGAFNEIFLDGFSYPYFPGFRRYIPAMAFPAFFALVGFVWKIAGGSKDGASKTRPLALLGTIACFAYTVFSYFYVWTTAVAWLGCFALLLIAVRPKGVWPDIRSLLVMATGFLVVLAPYAYLLTKRSETLDDTQMLVLTHAPDLNRMPAIISYFVLIALGAAVAFKEAELSNRAVLFSASLALSVIVVFNQQIITGRQLQPIHYQVFIGNYVAGLALVLTLGIYLRSFIAKHPKRAKIFAVGLASIAVVWGFVECHYTVRVLDDVNVVRDEALPVARRLSELVMDGPDPRKINVLHLDVAEADDLPTVAPVSVLWARHQHIFAGVTTEENKERYYQLLYYEGVSGTQLADRMKHGDFVSVIALFGWGRHTDRLNSAYQPLTYREVDAAADEYDRYVQRFNGDHQGAVPIDYLIARSDDSIPFDNIDKWYRRDAGEKVGQYTLYRLTPR